MARQKYRSCMVAYRDCWRAEGGTDSVRACEILCPSENGWNRRIAPRRICYELSGPIIVSPLDGLIENVACCSIEMDWEGNFGTASSRRIIGGFSLRTLATGDKQRQDWQAQKETWKILEFHLESFQHLAR